VVDDDMQSFSNVETHDLIFEVEDRLRLRLFWDDDVSDEGQNSMNTMPVVFFEDSLDISKSASTSTSLLLKEHFEPFRSWCSTEKHFAD
jgi:hypothetical protein